MFDDDVFFFSEYVCLNFGILYKPFGYCNSFENSVSDSKRGIGVNNSIHRFFKTF